MYLIGFVDAISLEIMITKDFLLVAFLPRLEVQTAVGGCGNYGPWCLYKRFLPTTYVE